MVNEVIAYLGGTTAAAKILGVQPAAVSQWLACGQIPPRRAIQIERLTGGVYKAVDIEGATDGDNSDET